jgi:hypothetical protein
MAAGVALSVAAELPQVLHPLGTIDKDGGLHAVTMKYFALEGEFYMTSYGNARSSRR